jgi:formyl-CoA transferase
VPAPLLGQHTVEVLREYGFSDERIHALKGEGAIIAGDVTA